MWEVQCTDIDIMIWKDSATNTGVPSYAVDGGTVITPAQPTAGNDYFPWITISGLANTVHTIVLSGPASGYVYLSGIRPRTGSALGVEVNRLGIAGAVLNDLSAPNGSALNKERVRRSVIMGTKADLLIVECDTNDGALPTPASAWKADMQAWIDTATSNGACVLIVGDPRSSVRDASIEDGYAQASQELAAGNTHCSYIRIADWWGTYALGSELGLYNAGSSVHPGRRGHGDVARVLHDAVTGRLNAGVIAPA